MPATSEPPGATATARVRAFGPRYVEELTLRNGTRVRLRPIGPGDKQRLAEGLARLSPKSRYLRFFTDKERLTEAELRYLTEIDGDTHFAIGASEVTEDGREGKGLGIGRFVRLAGEPDVAEPALAVVDDAQGQGLGRMLLLRLVAAATERGIKAFRCDFLAINHGMHELLRDVSPDVRFHSNGPVVTAEFRLPTVPADEPIERAPLVGPLFHWLKLVAEQVVELRLMVESGGEVLLRQWQELQRQLRQGRKGVGREDVAASRSSDGS
ncbi:GNAT family N-acetyltransferase [Paraliomyxa miuraensis]|uniref:GNAT family N-acetyltransferase n=1 Tax=Paraliomyxa miuraensis TaxID=376150 RepID=UPI0022572E27|nr:GNAT family N-acetyltransferase [Paraliomyxa miuraensis]MCX4243435.1 GNAT family N-acetyltransferase [Paraliomyxa miuraensis]